MVTLQRFEDCGAGAGLEGQTKGLSQRKRFQNYMRPFHQAYHRNQDGLRPEIKLQLRGLRFLCGRNQLRTLHRIQPVAGGDFYL